MYLYNSSSSIGLDNAFVCPFGNSLSPHWVSNRHSWDSWSKTAASLFSGQELGARERECVIEHDKRERGLGNGVGQSDERRGERRQEGGAFVLEREDAV